MDLPAKPKKTYNLLVIECQSMLNWYKIFEGATLSDGSIVHVEQAEWDDILPISYADTGAVTSLNIAKKPLPGTSQNQQRTIKVDFILLRSVSHGINGQDSRNKLFTFIHANIPSVNSLQSAYMCLERPTVFGSLKQIEKKLGKDFPLIEQNLYPTHRTLVVTPSYPIVCKVGHAHAGYGKMKFDKPGDLADFRGLIALHEDYVTVEPFIEWDFDMRIQKIGPHYRGFKRVSPNWKGNVGNQSVLDDMEVTPQYKAMVDECAQLFGGLEILGLDLLHSKIDGKDYILELNDTAIGLVHKYEEEDMGYMRDIVIEKMNKTFVKNYYDSDKLPASALSSDSPSPSTSLSPSSSHSTDLNALREQVNLLQTALKREKSITAKLREELKQGKKGEDEDELESSPLQSILSFFG